MDHKVSKDMISSGMIPSGEKTQSDLGRIQYGSAPSPSSLMDAYRSIYEHHQKDKDGNTIPHEDEINEMAGLARKAVVKAAKNRQLSLPIGGKTPAKKPVGGPKAAKRAPSPEPTKPTSLMGRVSKGLQGAADRAGRADKAIAARGGLKKMGTDYLKKNKGNIKGALLGRTAAGTAARIGGAYVAGRMMGGEKKNDGGYSSYDINFGYTPEGDTLSEDLFDALKSALIQEGCDEKNVMKIMASVTPDYFDEIIQEENIDEAVVTGSILAGLAAKKLLGLAAKKALVGATKMAMKKGTTAAATKLVGKVGAKKAAGMVAKKAAVGTGKAMVKNPVNTALAGSMMMPQGGGGAQPQATQRVAASGKRTAGGLRMDLDLFDVVKGQLLDEGLTEEEVLDVMTTLTIDEIQEGLGKLTLGQIAKGVTKTAAVGAGGALAYQGIKKGKQVVDDAINKARDKGFGGNTRPGADKIYFGR